MKTKTKKAKKQSRAQKEKILRGLANMVLTAALDDLRSGREAPGPMLQLEAALLEIKFQFGSE